ncbi:MULTISPECIES: NAD(P)/FAD-dependent oxidoreductase [unclassified Mycobacterium]|uniref:FAD-dependent oxidoreductase n=1 Tax=unclassified Mycobacterium TaxID=2642494 RepID=UPI0027418421|nr:MULTISPECIES: NAD(P)-binding protein [unclassified Mycobacterium]MDP7703569.1 NAD(P)-binding protein [Mycobacterium sp. TY815]MDP7722051.1 NAD(P)-binding protein [Mycobacterium sp. TY814]
MVIGASIAGLSAARVLSDYYERVTVFERDDLPSAPANRATVPQDRHLHMLMARGANEFESLFPGLLNDMVAAGVPMLENRPDCIHLGAAGHVLGTGHTLRDEFTAYVPSRPHLEWQIRRRVLEIDNVEIVRRPVAEPRFEPAAQRVTGVLLDPAVRGEEPEFIAADLVVDAAGRGTRLPVWLDQWGYQRAPEATVDIGINYATHQFRMPEGLIAEKVVVAGASHDKSLGLGMLYYEDGTWVLTTFGVAHEKPPRTFPEMLALADDLLPEHFNKALAQAEPLGEPAYHAFPVSRWRRYHKLERFPAGIIPFGDAVASFNPTFGQGMTMTSIQAGNLRRALESPDGDLAATLARFTAKTTFPVWMMNAIGDVALHHATGHPEPRWWRAVGGLFDQFLGAAETDPVLAEWFLRRFSLLDSLYMIPPARLIGRTMAHNMRLWMKERRELRAQGRQRGLVTSPR